MDSWQRFDETSLPDKKAFYSNLNMEDIDCILILKMLTVGTEKQYLNILLIKILVIIMICMFKVIHYCLQMFLKILET